MKVKRGDVALAFYPFASGIGGSRRPVLVVQSDTENQRLKNTIVAQITSNLRRAQEPTHFRIDVGTPEGTSSGLLHDFLVSCINLGTIAEDRIDKVIGHHSDAAMQQIDACLKTALGLQ
jgi:mRNA interferase MazF